MSVTVEFQYTKKEFSKAVRQFYGKKIIHNIVLSVIIALIGILFIRDYYSPSLVVLITASGISFLTSIAASYILPNTRYNSEPKYRSKYILVFSYDGIQGTMGNLESKIDWDFYKKAQENKMFYFLVYGKDLFSIIPKRVFLSKEQEQIFRDIVEDKLGKIQER